MTVRTFTIAGRQYREVVIEAADTRAAHVHVSAARPIGFTAAREVREGTRAA